MEFKHFVHGDYIVIKIIYTSMFTNLNFEIGYKHKSKYIYFKTSKTRVIKHTGVHTNYYFKYGLRVHIYLDACTKNR